MNNVQNISPNLVSSSLHPHETEMISWSNLHAHVCKDFSNYTVSSYCVFTTGLSTTDALYSLSNAAPLCLDFSLWSVHATYFTVVFLWLESICLLNKGDEQYLQYLLYVLI